MADTFSEVLELTIQTVGGNENTWGSKNNDNFQRVDDKLGKLTTVNTTGGTTVLSDAQEFAAAIRVTGTLLSNATLEFSGRKGWWIIFNDTEGAFTLTCDAGTETVQVTQGTPSIIYCDGTDTITVTEVGDFLTSEAWPAEVTVASAGTADVLGAETLFVLVSGTTTITSLGTGAWRYRVVRFSGVLTLTHNGTSLILPGAANIVTAAGDVAIVVSDGSSNARVISYQRASGLPLSTALAALGALTPASDKLPYFSGSSAASLTDLTSFIRTLLDDADAATARATLDTERLGVMRGSRPITSSETLVITDNGQIIEANHASVAIVITIPTNDAVTFPEDAYFMPVRYGAAATTVKGDTGVTLNGVSGGTITLPAQYDGGLCYKRGTNEWVMPGYSAV